MDENKVRAAAMSELSAGLEQQKPCEENCPKCGSSDVLRNFWQKNSTREAKKWGAVEGKYEGVNGSKRWATRDHIAHHCRCCQYAWKGLPLSKSRKSSNT